MNRDSKKKERKRLKRKKKARKEFDKKAKQLDKLYRNNPPNLLSVPSNTSKYRCATEEDGTPQVGCGHIFWDQSGPSVKCPQCGNFWVIWENFQQE